MFSKLLKRKEPVRAPENPRVPDGEIVWAIGDIHGRLDLLKPLVEVIHADAAEAHGLRTRVIFLGDYIDRGPDSRGVIQHLVALPKGKGIEWRFLKGNHEEAMLDFLEDPTQGAKWCEYGGDATLASYGLRVPNLKHKPEAWAHLSADLDHRVTASERRFLEELELSLAVGDYFFAHAGARPGEQLDNQDASDLLWIRRSFLESPEHFDKVVVHGHTPTEDVHFDQRRIGVDTKAYESGRLSAVRFEGADRRVVTSCMSDQAPSAASVDVVGVRTSV
jgi:serine/threonine protein phosphatase 1